MLITRFWNRLAACMHRAIHDLIESNLLYPVFAALVLVVLWIGTQSLIVVERNNADTAAQALTRELTDTYEAQVVRVLREIDQNLKLVQYAYKQPPQGSVLATLDNHKLLPSPFIFTVAVINSNGDLVESTAPLGDDIIDATYLALHRDSDDIQVAKPQWDAVADSWQLLFSRRLAQSSDDFAGIVVISVAADFFVSSYEAQKMGNQGVLGLFGSDGVYRAWRVGDSVSADQRIDVTPAASTTDFMDLETHVRRLASPIDNVERYVATRELFDFPLTVEVGLSRHEQLAAATEKAQFYRWRAAAASVLVLVIAAVLWRMGRQLTASRRQEVQARIEHAAQVEYLAYHDGLTGLPNRSLFSKLLSQNISLSQRQGHRLAVMFIDLDHFKFINDTLGHDAGDALLQEVASRLKDSLRDSDIVARLGGDEFVIVMPQIKDIAYTSTVARKIITAVAKPYQLRNQTFRVTASVGISTFPDDGLDEQSLTKNADIAMYKAKEEGKNNFQLYSKALHSESLERLTLESSLRHALERDELKLVYQVKRNMASGQITGMEALLRWQHPDLGVVAPMRFLQVAEDIGQIIPIGQWVLHTVCAQNMRWQRQGRPRFTIAVNLTAHQFFSETLATDIKAALTTSGMDAELLELEISENVLMQNADKAVVVLNMLKTIGVRVAIDNFGVGYSSLSMLKRFSLNAIKIDRSFIRDIASVAEDKTLAEAIVNMGRSLGMTVVAQGVETQEQVDFLRDHACDEVQGFYYNEPVSEEDMEALFAQPAVALRESKG